MQLDIQRRLGLRVRGLRELSHLTQEKLAERCGFTSKFISTVERGKVNVPLLTLATIAHELGVTLTELTLGVDAPMPREVRKIEQLYAGRPDREQALIGRVLSAIGDLVEDDGSSMAAEPSYPRRERRRGKT